MNDQDPRSGAVAEDRDAVAAGDRGDAEPSSTPRATGAAVARRFVARAAWLLRPRLPLLLVRPFVRLKIRRALADPATMADARSHMEHLLGATGRSDEVEAASRRYVEHWVWCRELRWHPRSIVRQRVEGAEHLVAAHALGRGVLLSFVHHAHFDGAFASVARGGVPVHVMAGAREMASHGPRIRQHLRVVAKGGGLVSAAVGTSGIVERLGRGEVIAAAIDVPGGSVATLAGRQVRCSSGPVRAAFSAGAPLVILTSHQTARGSCLRLSEPLDPEQFESTEAMLLEVVRRHEAALLAWPEVAYLPRVCWRPVDAG